MGYIRAIVLVAPLGIALPGCGDSSAPSGSGSHLTLDVDGSSAQAADVSDATLGDSPFAPLDGPYGPLQDGYSPLVLCAACACGAGTFCYGGSPDTPYTGSCDQTTSTTMNTGCHAIPAGCAAEPDCVCILQALASQRSCYQACADDAKGGFTVYCAP